MEFVSIEIELLLFLNIAQILYLQFCIFIQQSYHNNINNSILCNLIARCNSFFFIITITRRTNVFFLRVLIYHCIKSLLKYLKKHDNSRIQLKAEIN